MHLRTLAIVFAVFLAYSCPGLSLADDTTNATKNSATPRQESPNGQIKDTVAILSSLLELQKDLRQEIELTKKKIRQSNSDAEREGLEKEVTQLDKQLSEAVSDFERMATGVESAIFVQKKPQTFSWKDELTSLVEPAVKELKRFTIKARQKSHLKDSIAELKKLSGIAGEAVDHLQAIIDASEHKKVDKEVSDLLAEWINIEKRLLNKLGLTQLELVQLQEQEVSLLESSGDSIRIFFKDRGRYLIIALFTFVAVLVMCRVLYRAIILALHKLEYQVKHRSFQLRLIDILFQGASVVLAIVGLFFVLYLAEDWFLLSMAIIFFLGIFWTIRQGLPKLWQQARILLNVGSVREGERLVLHGVPWKVVAINIFTTLENPALGIKLRIPIEDLITMSSRPFHKDEPWFPCKKGDWVVVGSASRAKVISLSHEQVEVVERGGKRITYPTAVFLNQCPVNLSLNYRLRIPFGLSYSLQDQITTSIPDTLKTFLENKMEQEEYGRHCLNLQVEFEQAGSSSLDLLVLADCSGEVADISARIKRAIQKWCVECATRNKWEIPFPQLALHVENLPDK